MMQALSHRLRNLQNIRRFYRSEGKKGFCRSQVVSIHKTHLMLRLAMVFLQDHRFFQ